MQQWRLEIAFPTLLSKSNGRDLMCDTNRRDVIERSTRLKDLIGYRFLVVK